MESEFDLEISLKNAELKTILEEMSKTEEAIWKLETSMGLEPSVPAKPLNSNLKDEMNELPP